MRKIKKLLSTIIGPRSGGEQQPPKSGRGRLIRTGNRKDTPSCISLRDKTKSDAKPTKGTGE